MPGEWRTHAACWMLFPYRSDNWRENAYPAQLAFAKVANTIAKYERVKMCVVPPLLSLAKQLLKEDCSNIDIYAMEYDDAWMRDTGPTFLINKELPGKLQGIDWKFNAWGEIYSPYDRDDKVASCVMDLLPNMERRKRTDFVLEGGSVHVDGEGTVLTTEECLLHTNRNPHLTKADIEANLLSHLGASKVLWLPSGLNADTDTNGHVDNIACFSRPGEVANFSCAPYPSSSLPLTSSHTL
jgi:agmatine deiminase